MRPSSSWLRRRAFTTPSTFNRLKVSQSTAPLEPNSLMVGCAPLASEHDACEVVQTALDLGIVDFDTAPLYTQGNSERYLGAAVAKLSPEDADRVNIYTKCGRLLTTAKDHTTTVTNDYSFAGTLKSLHDSMARLGATGSQRIHALRIHDPNDSVERRLDVDEIAQSLGTDSADKGMVAALIEMRQTGQINSIGIGMNTNVETTTTSSPLGNLPPSLTDGVPAEVDRLLRGIPTNVPPLDEVLLAGGWTLLAQTGLASLTTCQQLGVNVSAAGIFSTGLLVGTKQYAYQQAPVAMVEHANRWEVLAQKYNQSLPTLAIGFARLPNCVTRIVVGCATKEEVLLNVQAAEKVHTIPFELWEEAWESGLLDASLKEQLEFC